jgi:phosphoribosylanthranilate isomerase
MLKVKICGLTNREDYLAAATLGADFAGFIFHEQSPRSVSPLFVKYISQLFSFPVKKVGVFVNEPLEDIRRIFDQTGLDIVQLHGEESPEYCRRLGLPYWKVIRIKNRLSLNQMYSYDCETFLLDTFLKEKHGGTSISFEWTIAQEAVRKGYQVIVAGGISSENIEEVSALRPYGVDLSSSLEERVGKKSLEKMSEFFSIIRRIRGQNGQT